MGVSKCFGKYHDWPGCRGCRLSIECRICTNKKKRVAAQKTLRERIDFYKSHPDELINQLEKCGYENEAGYLVRNVAFMALKELAEENHEPSFWGPSMVEQLMEVHPSFTILGTNTGRMLSSGGFRMRREGQDASDSIRYAMQSLKDMPPEEYKASVLGVWVDSEKVNVDIKIGTPVRLKEEKQMTKLAAVTFTANTRSCNCLEKEYTYKCPFDVKKGDIVMVDTQYGPSLAVVQRTWWDQNPCGFTKIILTPALNITNMTDSAEKELKSLLRKEGEIKKLEAEVQSLKDQCCIAASDEQCARKRKNDLNTILSRAECKLEAMKRCR